MPGGTGPKLFLSKNRVLRRLGDTEFHDLLGLDLDGFACRWIAADAGFPVDEDEFAKTGDGEAVLGVLIREGGELFENFDGLLFGDAVLVRDCGSDLRLGQCFCHDLLCCFK